MWLRYVPSETEDEICVFLPDATNSKAALGVHTHTTSCSDTPLPFSPPADPTVLGRGLLLSAEVIQGPSFPNLYSLRGTTFRNPLDWYQSVDILRQFRAWAMVPSHGVTLMGATNIETLLVNFRDAVQWTHDQTMRLMRQGFIPDEIVTMLPEVPAYILGLCARLYIDFLLLLTISFFFQTTWPHSSAGFQLRLL